MIMASAVDYEFRTTCVRPLVTGRTIDTISRLIHGARRYVLQSFRGDTVLHPEFFQDGRPHAFSGRAMARLQAIAAPRVVDCLVR
jgi:pyruvate formate lyase activating enzyme